MTHKTFVGSGQLKAHDRIRYDTPPGLPDGAAAAAGAGTPRGRFIGPLTDVQWQAVGVLFLTHARPRVRARAAAILLSAQGLSVRQIAEVLRARRQSVRKWFDWFEAEGEHGLLDEPRPGAPPRAGPAFVRRLREVAAVPPGSLGYAFDTWNAVRLRNHLVKVTGIQIGDERVRQLLRAEGLSFRRPVAAIPPAPGPTPNSGKPPDAARSAARAGGRRRPK